MVVGDYFQTDDHVFFVLLFDEAVDKEENFSDKYATLVAVHIVAIEDGGCALDYL